ncbi:MAG: hypothetical protein J7639_06810 [Paenibacillaceae bacterium]|nr:hypothetical protein [Paenibacillaceae bacterium]
MNKWAVALLLGLAATLLFGGKEAGPEPVPLEAAVTLLKETPFYESPYRPGSQIGTLNPQQVRIVGAEPNWMSFREESDSKWFVVDTWVGPRWVKLELGQLGTIGQEDLYFWLDRETHLYDSPFGGTGAGLTLTSQTVHVTAKFTSQFRNSYMIDTWSGPFWLVDSADYAYPVAPMNQRLTLPTITATFALPTASKGNADYLQPQSVTVFERFDDSWLHVRTQTGETAWINRKFAEPEGVVTIDQPINVHVTTTLYKYPHVDEFGISSISPQVVKAFEKWTSPSDREVWYHIYTWQGFAWMPAP